MTTETRCNPDGSIIEVRGQATPEEQNAATLTAQGLAAMRANLTWLTNVLPQIQSGVDIIQARAKPTAPTNIAGVNTILSTLWDDVRNLSLAVETHSQQFGTALQQNNALIRLVLEQLDGTD